MRLHLTGHALDELSERGLERQWVERVATDPEGMKPSRVRAGVDLRFGRIAEAGGKVLRVTTIDEGDVWVVIATHFDRKATRAARKTDAHDL
jgi:hypothetical protein